MIELTALQKGMLEDGIEAPIHRRPRLRPAYGRGAHRVLEHVEFALDLIGTTFNASLNHEGLAAFNDIVHQVDRDLQEEWVRRSWPGPSTARSLLRPAHRSRARPRSSFAGLVPARLRSSKVAIPPPGDYHPSSSLFCVAPTHVGSEFPNTALGHLTQSVSNRP